MTWRPVMFVNETRMLPTFTHYILKNDKTSGEHEANATRALRFVFHFLFSCTRAHHRRIFSIERCVWKSATKRKKRGHLNVSHKIKILVLDKLCSCSIVCERQRRNIDGDKILAFQQQNKLIWKIGSVSQGTHTVWTERGAILPYMNISSHHQTQFTYFEEWTFGHRYQFEVPESLCFVIGGPRNWNTSFEHVAKAATNTCRACKRASEWEKPQANMSV